MFAPPDSGAEAPHPQRTGSDPGDLFLQRVLQAHRETGFFLFVGPDGSDLEERAIWFFQSAMCRNRKDGVLPCEVCPSCVALSKRVFSDLAIVRPRPEAREIRIADVREALRWLPVRAHYGRKLLLISPAEALNPESGNALLRALEEPHDEAVIILIAFREWQLLETLRSRAIRVPFRSPLHKSTGDTPMERFFNHRKTLCDFWQDDFQRVWHTSRNILYGIATSRTPDWAFGLIRTLVDQISREADDKEESRRKRAQSDEGTRESEESISRIALWDLYLQVLSAQALDLWRVEHGWEPLYLNADEIRPFLSVYRPNWRGIYSGMHRLRRLLHETNVNLRWTLFLELLRNVRK